MPNKLISRHYNQSLVEQGQLRSLGGNPNNPEDIAFDSSGNIYLQGKRNTDPYTNVIEKYNSTFTTRLWAKTPSGSFGRLGVRGDYVYYVTDDTPVSIIPNHKIFNDDGSINVENYHNRCYAWIYDLDGNLVISLAAGRTLNWPKYSESPYPKKWKVNLKMQVQAHNKLWIDGDDCFYVINQVVTSPRDSYIYKIQWRNITDPSYDPALHDAVVLWSYACGNLSIHPICLDNSDLDLYTNKESAGILSVVKIDTSDGSDTSLTNYTLSHPRDIAVVGGELFLIGNGLKYPPDLTVYLLSSINKTTGAFIWGLTSADIDPIFAHGDLDSTGNNYFITTDPVGIEALHKVSQASQSIVSSAWTGEDPVIVRRRATDNKLFLIAWSYPSQHAATKFDISGPTLDVKYDATVDDFGAYFDNDTAKRFMPAIRKTTATFTTNPDDRGFMINDNGFRKKIFNSNADPKKYIAMPWTYENTYQRPVESVGFTEWNDFCFDNSGNIYFVTSSSQTSSGYNGANVIKYDRNANLVWAVTVPTTRLNGITTDSTDTYLVVVGRPDGTTSPFPNLWLLNQSNGAVSTSNALNSIELNDVVLDGSNNIYVSYGNANLASKFNSSFINQWDFAPTGGTSIAAYDMVLSSSYLYLATARTDGASDYLGSKINLATGAEVVAYRTGTGKGARGQTITVHPTTGEVACGTSWNPGDRTYVFANSGTIVWSGHYPENNLVHTMQFDGDYLWIGGTGGYNDYNITGENYNMGHSNLVKFDKANGDVHGGYWTRATVRHIEIVGDYLYDCGSPFSNWELFN